MLLTLTFASDEVSVGALQSAAQHRRAVELGGSRASEGDSYRDLAAAGEGNGCGDSVGQGIEIFGVV